MQWLEIAFRMYNMMAYMEIDVLCFQTLEIEDFRMKPFKMARK